MNLSHVLFEERDAIATLSLNRPERATRCHST